jgi:hypothetical protein
MQMKAARYVLVVLAVFLITYPLMLRVEEWAGIGSLMALAAALFGMAAWSGHTPESRAIADCIFGALSDVGMSGKEAAILADIPESTLSNWKSGKEQASIYRMAQWGAEFWVAFASRIVAMHDAGMVLKANALCDLVNSVQQLTAEVRRPRMLTASLMEARKQEVA